MLSVGIVGRSNISYDGTIPWSSTGISTTVIKSVPSPGSPSHTPSLPIFSVSSICSLCAFTFAWSCSRRFSVVSLSFVSPFSDTNSASGITTSSVLLAGVSVSTTSSVGFVVVSAAVVSTGVSVEVSVTVSLVSSAALSSFTLLFGVSSTVVFAVVGVSSFFFRPRFFGASTGFSISASCFSLVCVSGKSLNKLGDVLFCTLFFCRSKFSPSFP